MQTLKTTIKAGADLNAASCQYHAIVMAGTIAATGGVAAGILLNKPKSGEGAEVCYMGEERFAAGGAVSQGKALTVTTSGWFVAAASGHYIVGRAKDAVTSGSIGIGFFDFAKPRYAAESAHAW